MEIEINTCEDESDIITINRDSKILAQTSTPPSKSSNKLLELINQLLTQNQFELKKVTTIKVNPGPGNRFTRTRLGVTIANALAYGLDVPINQKKFEIPIYHQEPTITQPK